MEKVKRGIAVGAVLLALLAFNRASFAQSSPDSPTAKAAVTIAAAAPAPHIAAAAQTPSAARSTAASVAIAAVIPPSPAANSSPAVIIDGKQTAPAANPSPALQSALLIAPVKKNPDDTSEGRRLYARTTDGSDSDPMSWSMHVFKSSHRIELYYKNHLFRTYHAVFGRSRWAGGKEWEGDSRTPEGAYLIIAKHRSARFKWFLRLNYPNATDEERFAELRATHQLPRSAREGGQVGIHGTDSPILNIGDVNWTLGCISVSNDDIDEMARLLPIGTLVVINP